MTATLSSPLSTDDTAPEQLSEYVAVEVAAAGAIAHLERIVGLLRVRGPRIERISSDLGAACATVTVWGRDLHGGSVDALLVRRLERLPGVLRVRVG